MIYVTDNGVPLSAVVSVEFNEPVVHVHDDLTDALVYSLSQPWGVSFPTIKLPCTEVEARRLRDEWEDMWPRIAAWRTKK